MQHQNDSMKWITDPKGDAPADRQVSLAIFGVLGSFVVFWGALGYLSGEQVNRKEPVARNEVETVQLLPRGGSLDDPRPLPVPELSPVDLPEGATSTEPGGGVTVGAATGEGATVVQASGHNEASKEKSGLWGWVTSIFSDDDKEQAVVRTQPIASRPAGESPAAAKPQAEAVPAPEQPAPANPAPANPAPAPANPAPANPAPANPAPAQPQPSVPAPAPKPTPPKTDNSIADPTMIAELFNTLRIAPEVDSTGYTKDIFGEGWTDTDDNKCDTRNDIFGRDMTDVVRGEDCQVLTGTLTDPYTGASFAYEADPQTADDVQIDHVVSLHNAWVTGGQELPTDLKTTFKNDPLNLVTVLGKSKELKGDQNAAKWLPTTPFACEYIGRQIAVKARYGLWVTPEEHTALKNGLAACAPMRVDGDAIKFVKASSK